MKPEILSFPLLTDARGSLAPIEFTKHIPFVPARLFTLSGMPSDVNRGGHAHIATSQILLVLQGACVLELDNGLEKQSFNLDTPQKGVLVPPLHWDSLHSFAPNTVILVLSDRVYSPEDYIRDYSNFLALVHA